MTTATLPAPAPTMPTQRPYRWTVKAFHRAVMQKTWGDGKRMILINGEIFEVPFLTPEHATGIMRMQKWLPSCVPAGHELRSQLPLALNLDSDPIPDFAVVFGNIEDFARRHPTTARLVVEISKTSLDFDLTTKAELYATANVPEYWVVDVIGRRLYVLRDPQPIPGNGGNSYRDQKTYTDADSIAPLIAPDKPIRVADLLP
jgi:Uma2 family endonuclease